MGLVREISFSAHFDLLESRSLEIARSREESTYARIQRARFRSIYEQSRINHVQLRLAVWLIVIADRHCCRNKSFAASGFSSAFDITSRRRDVPAESTTVCMLDVKCPRGRDRACRKKVKVPRRRLKIRYPRSY